MDLSIEALLQSVIDTKSSDLHLLGEEYPQIRKDGSIMALDLPEKLTKEQNQTLLYSVLSDKQKRKFEEEKELDFALDLDNIGRFRVNYYKERGMSAGAFRIIPTKIPSAEELNMPKVIRDFCNLEKGLLLVTGPTGSGKSTTMAAIINEINENHEKHILTIEDPIEFLHKNKKSIFSQREVGTDTSSFEMALREALRQDPDVILVGEMRDLETIRAAITASETGHLVIGTLHTNSATQTITRIVNVFPEGEQSLIRTQLSMTLKGIVSQILVPKIKGGRKAIQEILVMNPAISNLIRENKLPQIPSTMETNQMVTRMQTQTQELVKAVKAGEISTDVALRFANNQEELKSKI